jgi:hypothetical protein
MHVVPKVGCLQWEECAGVYFFFFFFFCACSPEHGAGDDNQAEQHAKEMAIVQSNMGAAAMGDVGPVASLDNAPI